MSTMPSLLLPSALEGTFKNVSVKPFSQVLPGPSSVTGVSLQCNILIMEPASEDVATPVCRTPEN